MFEAILNPFRQRQTRPLVTQEIGIKGMTCKSCVKTIKKALLTKNGVKQVYIDLESGVASVTYDPSLADRADASPDHLAEGLLFRCLPRNK